MGLFEKIKRPEKNKTAVFYVDVEEVTEHEFDRLKQWVKENIPSTERFTPEWKEDVPSLGGALGVVSINIGAPIGAPTGNHAKKLRFRFKYEEHAMAFKLIL